MLLHNLRVAWKSLRRNTLLTALIISGIALGIGISTTFAAVRHSFARDPIPRKSRVLYYVRLDSWDPLKPYPGDDPTRPPTQITYRDMVEIMRSKIPARQGGMFKTNLYVYPDAKAGRPFREMVRLCFADFFPMFDVPFLYGSGWDARADAGPEPVVVVSFTKFLMILTVSVSVPPQPTRAAANVAPSNVKLNEFAMIGSPRLAR